MSPDGFVAGPDQSVENPLSEKDRHEMNLHFVHEPGAQIHEDEPRPPSISSERLFEDTGTDFHGLKLVRTVPTDRVTHLKFARH
jgi:hypothetical protein